MDSYAIEEFERIQRALDKIIAEIEILREENQY